jgi:hypothetical protein
MLGVDKNNQMRAASGAFAAKAHYQKWYKRVYMAILDMMTMNHLVVWNLLVDRNNDKKNPVPNTLLLFPAEQNCLNRASRQACVWQYSCKIVLS